MTSTVAIALAAGRGTRMKSRTPKALHTVGGKPMLRRVVDAARDAGCDPIIVVTPPDSSPARAALGGGCEFVVQPKALGAANALLSARDAAGGFQTIVALNSDIPLITPRSLRSVIEIRAASNAPMSIATAVAADPSGLGRVVRDDGGRVEAVIEQAIADEDTLRIQEINAGVYCFDAVWLWENLPKLEPSPTGEPLLTELVSMAASQGRGVAALTLDDPNEAIGVNTRAQLAVAESIERDRIRKKWMRQGVTMTDPSSVYIDSAAKIGMDTILMPNTHVRGGSRIGEGCEIGPNSIIDDSIIADDVSVVSSVVENSTLESDVTVGPFSHIRPGCLIEAGAHIGNYCEVKNSRIGRGAKSGHVSYIGDADVGRDANIGAGAITCNYDGEHKHRTAIGDDTFIGCDTMMVAPVSIGEGASTGAGSVVTRDVPPGAIAVGAPARMLPKGAANRARRGKRVANSDRRGA